MVCELRFGSLFESVAMQSVDHFQAPHVRLCEVRFMGLQQQQLQFNATVAAVVDVAVLAIVMVVQLL